MHLVVFLLPTLCLFSMRSTLLTSCFLVKQLLIRVTLYFLLCTYCMLWDAQILCTLSALHNFVSALHSAVYSVHLVFGVCTVFLYTWVSVCELFCECVQHTLHTWFLCTLDDPMQCTQSVLDLSPFCTLFTLCTLLSAVCALCAIAVYQMHCALHVSTWCYLHYLHLLLLAGVCAKDSLQEKFLSRRGKLPK